MFISDLGKREFITIFEMCRPRITMDVVSSSNPSHTSLVSPTHSLYTRTARFLFIRKPMGVHVWRQYGKLKFILWQPILNSKIYDPSSCSFQTPGDSSMDWMTPSMSPYPFAHLLTPPPSSSLPLPSTLNHLDFSSYPNSWAYTYELASARIDIGQDGMLMKVIKTSLKWLEWWDTCDYHWKWNTMTYSSEKLCTWFHNEFSRFRFLRICLE